MRNKIVTLTSEDGREVYLHCARVYEAMDNRVILEIDNKKMTDNLWWHMHMCDTFGGEYEFRQEDKCPIWAVDQEIITAIHNY